ncbi:zinc finger protein 311-like [Ctenocephalides felis]|uniref:zinc finger protein 311-like n=1 Tax=Ctenocephalides felis TaxID=7515 RepID=UPI000E6E2EB0|nr:zinc finger protein 311-like [Ctenocephalides felis]
MDTTITNIPDNILTQSYPGEIVVTMDSNSSPICRACLADKNLQSLFIEQKQLSENENLILKMFISCTALDVSPDDEYPKYICDLCLRDLYKAYEFWTKCRNSLQELDKLKGKIQNVYIKEEFKPLDDQKDADTNICDDDKVVIDVQNKNVHAKLNSKVFRKTRVKKVKGDQNDAGIVKQELDDVIELDVLSNHSNHSYHDDIDNISNCEYNIHNDIKKEPQDSNNLHKCTTCNKSYKSLYYLNMHKKKHSGEQVKPTSSIIHLCQLCGVVLASSRNLREHLESHGDLRKYTCKTCGKSYKTKRTLYAHMEIHSIEKRHTCEHCGFQVFLQIN